MTAGRERDKGERANGRQLYREEGCLWKGATTLNRNSLTRPLNERRMKRPRFLSGWKKEKKKEEKKEKDTVRSRVF